jgi:hypothetical protein
MVLVGSVFGAVGTAGQRCTSTRRLIIHESVYDKTISVLQKAYGQLKIGNPLDANNHVGPLIDQNAVKDYLNAIEKAKQEGGKILVEGGVVEGEGYESGCYVKPCIIEAKNEFHIVQEETFAPILYVMKYKTIDEAIEMQNGVPQGLSSSIFTNNMREMELFLSHAGSDCGIANVNIGTSGAEIGGAFGGEKETVADANRAQMHGKHICADKRIPLTMVQACLWRRGSIFIFDLTPSSPLQRRGAIVEKPGRCSELLFGASLRVQAKQSHKNENEKQHIQKRNDIGRFAFVFCMCRSFTGEKNPCRIMERKSTAK